MPCGIFQLYFCDNLFNPNENSKIKDKARLNKRTIETLLNEHFVLDGQETKEATIRQCAVEQQHYDNVKKCVMVFLLRKQLTTFHRELLFFQRNIVVANNLVFDMLKQEKKLSCD